MIALYMIGCAAAGFYGGVKLSLAWYEIMEHEWDYE